MRKNECSRTSTHSYDFMAYTGFWKYSCIYITILDNTTMCTEVCKCLVNDQHDAQFFIVYLFLFLTLYMFQAHRAHHQERQIVSMRPLVTVTLCRWPCHVYIYILARQSPVGQGLLIHEVSRSHTTTHHIR
jgi:amino acid permease